MIDLVPDQKAIDPSETFDIMVAVGSGEKNGAKVLETDSVRVPISAAAAE